MNMYIYTRKFRLLRVKFDTIGRFADKDLRWQLHNTKLEYLSEFKLIIIVNGDTAKISESFDSSLST